MTNLHVRERTAALVAVIGGALLIAIVAPFGVATAAAAAPPAATPVEGVWQRHEATFTFAGFTSYYSCDGLADKLRLLLKEAGARADVKAVGGACTGPGGLSGPSRISTAYLVWYTLAPAATGAPAATAPVPPAAAPAREIGRAAPNLKKASEPQPGVGAWKAVKWSSNSPRELGEGDCELVEQFAREVLPKFTTRNVDSQMRCVPHQVSLGGVNLKFESLAPLPESEKAVAKPRPVQ